MAYNIFPKFKYYRYMKMDELPDQENIIGYDMDGNPISEKEYVSEILQDLHQLSEGKLETYSSQEVKIKIVG
jgi:hypothetical protein